MMLIALQIINLFYYFIKESTIFSWLFFVFFFLTKILYSVLKIIFYKVLAMLKNLISVFCVFCLLTACSEKKPPITGIDGSAIPPAFANFPDMPFPASAYVDLEDTKALGSGNNWIGSLVFNVDYSPSEVFDFYMSEMPKLGWIEVATVRARVSHMTYIQGRRAVQILIEMDSSDSSLVTVTAIPNENVIGRGK